MIKIDLFTGFLGAGKTTLIKEYVKYLVEKGESVCILENDHGAVNVDTMLLQDVLGENCDIETVAGACDPDCHRRRFKTKLIAMAMSGYTHVVVEPSGIFDVDEFFDALHEDPVSKWYEAGSVIAVADARMKDDLSPTEEYIMASEIAEAGLIVFSHLEVRNSVDSALKVIRSALHSVRCEKEIGHHNILAKDREDLTPEDFKRIETAGYDSCGYVKKGLAANNDYSTIYLMDSGIEKDALSAFSNEVFKKNEEYGKVARIKGFILKDGSWYECNITKNDTEIRHSEKGQHVIIVIGENMNEDSIIDTFKSFCPKDSKLISMSS
ncbi:MAG: GTPase (G3E family) [Lachnospiraceae bacterium]|nr:GTPase (G3E family) [Lachnospiraceae bacterium]